MSRLLNAYLNALKARPFVVQTISAGVLWGAGDLLAQRLSFEVRRHTTYAVQPAPPPNPNADPNAPPPPPPEDYNKIVAAIPWKWDTARTARMAGFGLLVSAPTAYGWYHLMDKFIPAQTTAASLQKVVIHSLCYAPFNISTAIGWIAYTAPGGTPDLALKRIQERMLGVWQAGSLFWIPVMAGTYRFVPLRYRVVVTSAASVVWTAFLSTTQTKQ